MVKHRARPIVGLQEENNGLLLGINQRDAGFRRKVIFPLFPFLSPHWAAAGPLVATTSPGQLRDADRWNEDACLTLSRVCTCSVFPFGNLEWRF